MKKEKSWLPYILIIIATVACGIWWIMVYNTKKKAKINYVDSESGVDTTFHFTPKNSYYMYLGEDTIYVLVDEHKNVIGRIKENKIIFNND